ncbi:MAG: hypothetical protein AB1405_06800 [Bdellovibrionota bacterium]
MKQKWPKGLAGLRGALAAALLGMLCACGGGGGGLQAIGQGPTFTGQIVASKKTAGEVFNMSLQGGAMHLAYGLTGLVTMRVSDLSDLRVMRITDTVVADDVAVCGGTAYVLTYLDPPLESRLIIFDVGTDPFLPQRLSEIRLTLAPGAKLACSGTEVYVGGGTSGFHLIDASNRSEPVDTTSVLEGFNSTCPAESPFAAVGFHQLLVQGTVLRAVVDLGGLPPQDDAQIRCQAAAPPAPDCALNPPVNCFGKFGIRSLNLSPADTGGGSCSAINQDICAPGWTDARIPDSADLEFPPSSGINTSPVNHPMAIAEDADFIYVASTNGRRLTILDKTGVTVFSENIPGVPGGVISDIDVLGDVLVLADGDVRIVDISGRDDLDILGQPAPFQNTPPFLSSTVFTPGRAFSVILASTTQQDEYLAYVADAENGLVVVRIAKNFFSPLPAAILARNIPGVGAVAVLPVFESTSPLFGTNALLRSEDNGGTNAPEGVLAEGRILVASTGNYAAPLAEGSATGSVLSIDVRAPGITLVPNPPDITTPVPGPYGLSTERARIYTQNSRCVYAADDPVCGATTDAEGHFLEFPYLAELANGLANLLSFFTLSLLPTGPEPLTLVAPPVPPAPLNPVTLPTEQTGPLAAVANPSSLVIARDGLVFAGSSGVSFTMNAPLPSPAIQPAPFAVVQEAGRAAPLDENGQPFAYRRMASPRPFDPVAYLAAVGGAQEGPLSPYPMFPWVQLRDEAGNLLDVPGFPGVPRTPDRPATGVFFGDEDERNFYLVPSDALPVAFRRTTEAAGPCTPGIGACVPCTTVDTDPFTLNPLLPPDQDEKTSLGLCHGLFGMAYGGAGNDLAQANEAATAGFDYYTRNATYFASTGDGGIVQIDLDSGVSQVSPIGTLHSLFDPAFAVPPPPPAGSCDSLLAQVEDGTQGQRDQVYAGSSGLPIQCDPFLRMGMVYSPQTRTLFAANPLNHSVTAVFLGLESSNTPQGVRYQTGFLHFAVGGLLDTPVDVAPVQPLPVSATQVAQGSDLYVADRGTGAIVRINQSGEFISVAQPLVGGRPLGRGRLAGMAISPDGEFLYLTVSEGCDLFLGPTSVGGCVLRVPTF